MERKRKLLGLTKSINHPRGTRMQMSLFSILGTGGHMRKLLLGKLLLAQYDSIKMFMWCVLHFNCSLPFQVCQMCYRKDYYQEGNQVYSELNVHDAYRRALNTWAKWVDNNINPKKTTLLFRGYSASHFRFVEPFLISYKFSSRRHIAIKPTDVCKCACFCCAAGGSGIQAAAATRKLNR